MLGGASSTHHPKWWCLAILALISCIIVVPLLLWESFTRDRQTDQTVDRPKRQAGTQDACLKKYGGISIVYTRGTKQGFKFDLCDVINCKGQEQSWRGYDLYICDSYSGGPSSADNGWCPHWGRALWGTGPHYVSGGYIQTRPAYAKTADFQKRGNLMRLPATTGKGGWNPVLLTLDKITSSPYAATKKGTYCGRDPDTIYLVLGVDQSGTDTMGLIKITFVDTPPDNQTDTSTVAPTALPEQSTNVLTIDYSKMTSGDVVKIATGYGDKNMWHEWMAATAGSMNMSDCIACSSARPLLFTVPAPLFPKDDPAGFQCMMSLIMHDNPANCTTLGAIFPPVKKTTIPPVFSPKPSNYICFARNNTSPLGDMPPDWCATTLNVTNWANASQMVVARADLFWYCGGETLLISLPSTWSGTCALVRLALPLFLPGYHPDQLKGSPRRRREAFDVTSGSTTYMDAIGVPRGVPDEYKLADQVAAGFENLPIIGALFPVTPNKIYKLFTTMFTDINV